MKEYTLIIKGEIDFIIIAPQVFSSLITQIHNSPERKVVVSIESIMPPKFTDYLLRVINSNRFSNERFRYAAIAELDESVLNRLISKILIGEIKKVDGQKVQEVRIGYNFVGEIPEIAA